MNMKKIIGLGLMLGSFCCFAQTGQKEGEVDYLKLTQENLPHRQVMIQAGLDYSDIDDYSLADNNRKIRMAALLPKLRLQAQLQEDGVPEYGYVDNFQTGSATIDRWNDTGDYGDRAVYGGYVEWDLSEVIWSRSMVSASQNKAREASVKRRRIVEISRRYTVLFGSLPKDSSESVRPGQIARILENAIYLDKITGYLLTDTLSQLER